MEAWDTYYANEEPAGVTVYRGQKRPEGLYNKAVVVLVRHTDGDYLLVRRCARKEAYPLWYETSAGGAVKAGEDERQGAERELCEETGIRCEELTKIGYFRDDTAGTHQYAFLCTVSCPKDSLVLQEEETDGYKWLSETAFIDFVNSDGFIPVHKPVLNGYFLRMGYLK